MDTGSIIDFVQNRVGGSLGTIRKDLRPWMDTAKTPIAPVHPSLFSVDLEPVSKDILQVQTRFGAMGPIEVHPYLEQGRGIPAQYLRSGLFKRRIYCDEKGNAVFPHYNQLGLCGYELKNEGFTGFAPGGTKGPWFSNVSDRDRYLAIAETAIDAISFAVDWPHALETRYFTIGGSMNEEQPGFLVSALQKMAPDVKIVLALDNDEGGDLLIEKLRGVFSDAGVSGERFLIRRPRERGQDWNDTLRSSMGE